MKYRGVTGLLAVGCVALAVIGFLASQSQYGTENYGEKRRH